MYVHNEPQKFFCLTSGVHFSFDTPSFFVVLEQFLEFLLQLSLGGSTYVLVNNLTVFDEQYGGDITDTILHGDIVILFYIALPRNQLLMAGCHSSNSRNSQL